MIDYYDVLGLGRDAKPEQIKRSYRKLVKKYHPDRNKGRGKWAEKKVREIIEAYDTLRDADDRATYDRRLSRHLRETSNLDDPYGDSLRNRGEDPEAQAKLVLHSLLNAEQAEAVAIVEKMQEKYPDFDLSHYLDLKDYLDCEFLLGEAYERLGKWREALRYYERVYEEERERPRRYFLPEVKDRLRELYCKKVARKLKPMEAVAVYQRVLALGIQKKTEAYIHKKIAESYFKASKMKKSKMHLEKAFSLEPKLKGAQKICQKLGVSSQTLAKANARS